MTALPAAAQTARKTRAEIRAGGAFIPIMIALLYTDGPARRKVRDAPNPGAGSAVGSTVFERLEES